MTLVQGQSRSRHAALLGRFAAAFTASALVVFGISAAIGAGIGHLLSVHVQIAVTFVALVAALALDAYSLTHRTWCPVTVRRQTPKRILLRYGDRRAALAWGLDTGLVFTTYRMSSISWALLLLVVLGIAPWWAALGYAAGFLVPLLFGCSVLRLRADPTDGSGLARAMSRYPQAARATCVAVIALAAVSAAGRLVA
jgi:hypothetical protein